MNDDTTTGDVPTDDDNLRVSHHTGRITLHHPDGDSVSLNENEAEIAAMMILRQLNGRSVLLDAYETARERAEEYGPPDENFEVAGDLQEAYLGVDADGFDYCMLMVLAKVARLRTGERRRDSLVDIAGYARGAAEYENIDE